MLRVQDMAPSVMPLICFSLLIDRKAGCKGCRLIGSKTVLRWVLCAQCALGLVHSGQHAPGNAQPCAQGMLMRDTILVGSSFVQHIHAGPVCSMAATTTARLGTRFSSIACRYYPISQASMQAVPAVWPSCFTGLLGQFARVLRVLASHTQPFVSAARGTGT